MIGAAEIVVLVATTAAGITAAIAAYIAFRGGPTEATDANNFRRTGDCFAIIRDHSEYFADLIRETNRRSRHPRGKR